MDERYLHLNRHGTLAVPGSLIAIMAFLLRNWVVVVVMAALMRRSPGAADWFHHGMSWGLLLVQAPMLLLAYAAGARLPGAGAIPRWAWRHGVAIISVTILLNLAWASYYLLGQAVWAPWPERCVLIAALIELAVGVGVWRSAYYQQIFQEFPAAPAPRTPAAQSPEVAS